MKLRHLIGLFLAGSLLVCGTTVWMTIEMDGALGKVAEAEQRRFQSIQLADELRQSSDDLTRFARMYVQTGDDRFATYYRNVLAIRNGELARPDDYEGPYWDRFIVDDQFRLAGGNGEASSLQDRMVQLGFTQAEFDLLTQAQERSDRLTKIEIRAFNAVRGLQDGTAGDNGGAGPPDRHLAQRLLFDNAYLRAKAAIMEPIGRFQNQVNTRTSAALSAVQSEANRLMFSTFLATGTLLVLLIAFTVLVHQRVLQRAGALAGAAEQITAGDLAVRSSVRGDDELGVLGKTFDDMVARLADNLELVTAARDRMEAELNVGREIQLSMVPLTFPSPAFPAYVEFSIRAALKPAREVSGDFYDFFFIDEHRICFCVGDVSGKGVPSALFMAVAKTLIKSRAADNLSTASILTHVNDELSANNSEYMFVTVFIGIVNIRTGEFVFTNAGHNPPYICRRDGSLLRLDARHGPIVAVLNGQEYAEERLHLDPADMVFVYTDGVTEAMDSEDNLFSEARLVDLLNEVKRETAEDVVHSTLTAVGEFEAGAEQGDDITVLAFRYHGGSGNPATARKHVEIGNDLSNIARVIDEFEVFAKKYGVPKPVVMKFNVVFDDILNNVISYAFRDDGEHVIEIDMECSSERVTVTVADDGIPFNPLDAEAPDTGLPLEDRQVGGLGIHLVKNLVDEMNYERRADGNVLTLAKNLA